MTGKAIEVSKISAFRNIGEEYRKIGEDPGQTPGNRPTFGEEGYKVNSKGSSKKSEYE